MCEEKLTRRDYEQQISALQVLIDQKVSDIRELQKQTGNNEAQIRQEESSLQVMQDNLADLQIKRNQCTY